MTVLRLKIVIWKGVGETHEKSRKTLAQKDYGQADRREVHQCLLKENTQQYTSGKAIKTHLGPKRMNTGTSVRHGRELDVLDLCITLAVFSYPQPSTGICSTSYDLQALGSSINKSRTSHISYYMLQTSIL